MFLIRDRVFSLFLSLFVFVIIFSEIKVSLEWRVNSSDWKTKNRLRRESAGELEKGPSSRGYSVQGLLLTFANNGISWQKTLHHPGNWQVFFISPDRDVKCEVCRSALGLCPGSSPALLLLTCESLSNFSSTPRLHPTKMPNGALTRTQLFHPSLVYAKKITRRQGVYTRNLCRAERSSFLRSSWYSSTVLSVTWRENVLNGNDGFVVEGMRVAEY